MSQRNTLILLGVLLALGLFVWYQNAAAPAEGEPTPGAIQYVWDLSDLNVTGLEVTDNTAGQSTALSKDAAGQWSILEPYPAEADPFEAEAAVSNAGYLSVQRTLTETTDLAEFGVLAPAFTLRVSLSDGSDRALSIGNKTPASDGFYVLRPGDANALVVSSYSLQPILDLVQTPPFAIPTETAVPLDLTALPPVSVEPSATP